MDIVHDTIEIATAGQGLYEFSERVVDFVDLSKMSEASLTVFCQHTSCSLIIQENADPDVQVDLNGFFERLVPQNMDWLIHTMEGPDDMPAHIKSVLTATSLSIPVCEGRAMFGMWQGIFLFEHRTRPHQRQIVMQLIGR